MGFRVGHSGGGDNFNTALLPANHRKKNPA